MNPSASPRRWPFIAAFVIVLLLVEGGYLIWSHAQKNPGRAHDQGDPGASGLALHDGQRWATDAPLRLGMQRIRDAVARQVKADDAASLPPAQAEALAATVRENVTYLMQNCQLAPAPDATLHLIVNDLMAGASLLTTEGQSAAGIAKLTQALRAYPTAFDHPDWHPLPAPQA